MRAARRLALRLLSGTSRMRRPSNGWPSSSGYLLERITVPSSYLFPISLT